MSKLLIFGAGASRNYSQHTHGVEGLRMPLDADFFKMVKKISLSKEEYLDYYGYRGFERVLEDLWELFKTKDTIRYNVNIGDNPIEDLKILDDSRLSLEQIISMYYEYPIFDDDHYDLFPGTSKSRLKSLIEVIVYTLWLAQKGPTCDKHLAIAKKLNKDDIVISFNYDTILDNALRESKKITDLGYKIDFNKVFSDDKWQFPEQNDSDVTLLKLHGSLNWLRCKRCKLNFLNKTNTDLRRLNETWGILNPKCIRCDTLSVETVIIPPLIGKNYHEFGLDYLWSDAYQIINNSKANVNEIIIVGYSLPRADIASNLLFRKINHSITSSNPKFKLTIINPDKDMKKYFGEIFSPSQIFQHTSIEQFIEQFN